MTTLQRYALFQIPGWLATIGACWVAHLWFDLPLWAGAGVLVLLLAKDFALYPWLKIGYSTTARSGRDALIGASGVVTQPIAPEGMVKISSELWQARSDTALAPGEAVVVVAVDHMTVVVRGASDSRRHP